MTTMKKLALVSAIAAVSSGAQADLKVLDDAVLGNMTGQSGLTIDVETKFTIGEFAYKDGGFIILQGISLGANDNLTYGTGVGEQRGSSTMLDNHRLDIDIAGNGAGGDNVLASGWSEMREFAQHHVDEGNLNADMIAAAGGFDNTTSLAIEDHKTYDDGDLVIHFGWTDAWQQGGGYAAYANNSGDDGAGNMTAGLNSLTYTAARDIALRAVDFNFSIDMIGIASSGYTIGSASAAVAANPFGTSVNAVTGEINGTNHATGIDTNPSTTALISGLSVNGFLGEADLHIENDGNGFGDDGSQRDSDGDGIGDVAGTGNADSKIYWSSYFNITDLDVYIDIAGVQLTDVKINNTRGDLSDINGNASFGFAHSIRTIYAVKDTVLHVNASSAAGSTNAAHYHDGVAINTHFKGDMEIGALSFGDTGNSIGEIYITDMESVTNWTISAH